MTFRDEYIRDLINQAKRARPPKDPDEWRSGDALAHAIRQLNTPNPSPEQMATLTWLAEIWAQRGMSWTREHEYLTRCIDVWVRG